MGEPRFYLLSKGSTETFGFCLHEELGCQGHIIRQVELGGLAQRRGLQDGDRLLQVNGHFVDHMEHHRVSREHPGNEGTPGYRQLGSEGVQDAGLTGGELCSGSAAWPLAGGAEDQGQREPGPACSAGWRLL